MSKPVWICEGCGEVFDEERTSHGRFHMNTKEEAEEVECGPITQYLPPSPAPVAREREKMLALLNRAHVVLAKSGKMDEAEANVFAAIRALSPPRPSRGRLA